MSRLRGAWLLALCVLFSSSAPQAFAAWQCEGHDCGATPARCCCDAPAREDGCGSGEAEAEPDSAHGDCACVLISRAPDARASAGGASLAAPVQAPALPGVAGLCFPPATCRVGVPLIDERGPPGASPVLATPGLRAPPATAWPLLTS